MIFLYVFLVSFIFSSTYNVGDQISIAHQNAEYDICYGSELDLNGDGVHDIAEVSEPFEDFGVDQIEGTNDLGEKNGKWDGYSMINCEPIVRTDQDGYARIIAVFPRELCIWQATDEETGICTFEDFSATMSSTLLIPQITTSDPLDIQLVRTQTTVGCP